MATAPLSLPLVDLSAFTPGTTPPRTFLESLNTAAHEIGFFYLTGHGVAPDLLTRVQSLSQRFFALPEADKLQISMEKSPQFRGYTRVGAERTKGRPDWREQLDVGIEAAPRPPQNGEPDWYHLVGPNLWPASLPELKPVLLEYQAELNRVLGTLTEAFAALLSQPRNAFDYLYKGRPNNLLKIIRYPGQDATGDSQGVGAHKDGGLLTAVLQQDLGGLQVETDSGWIDAVPVPGTFVVNIGELLELASNGYLKATVHRVVSPPAGRVRLSTAFFFGAAFDAVIKPLELPPALAAKADGPDRDPTNPLYYDVGRNSLKSRLRSHPNVAQIHYPGISID